MTGTYSSWAPTPPKTTNCPVKPRRHARLGERAPLLRPPINPEPSPPGAIIAQEAGPLDLATASDWTARYRQQQPGQLQAYFFGRQIIARILAQPGCRGLRIRYALDARNQQHLLITGVDAMGDQLPGQTTLPKEGGEQRPGPFPPVKTGLGPPDFVIAEMAIPCPDRCSEANRLNGRQTAGGSLPPAP